MTTTNEWLITPTKGFTPHIGVLVATLAHCRERTIQWTKELTIEQLDFQFDDQANTIGGLLLHMAAMEAAYQELTFNRRNILNTERIDKWRVPLYLGDSARREIRGYPVSYYLDELAAIRLQTLDQFKRYDDSWLWEDSPYGTSGIANNYWMWYHVYEDEINHRGVISWLKSRIPTSAERHHKQWAV